MWGVQDIPCITLCEDFKVSLCLIWCQFTVRPFLNHILRFVMIVVVSCWLPFYVYVYFMFSAWYSMKSLESCVHVSWVFSSIFSIIVHIWFFFLPSTQTVINYTITSVIKLLLVLLMHEKPLCPSILKPFDKWRMKFSNIHVFSYSSNNFLIEGYKQLVKNLPSR